MTSSPTLAPGQSETVSVFFVSTDKFLLQATDLAVSYDSTRFSVSNVLLGDGTLTGGLDSPNSGFSQSVGMPASGVPGVGEVTTSASTGTVGNQINVGTTGALETFTLTALASAPQGAGQIIIQQNFGNTNTAVYADANGNAIMLVPPPTNTFNATIDRLVTVTPEPASLVMMGLGGGIVTLTTLLRKKGRRASRTR